MKKRNFFYYAVSALAVLLLGGCVSVSSTPSPRFYMPDSMSKNLAQEKFKIPTGLIVAVGSVIIPTYQDRPQIVTRNKDGTLNFAQFDRWGEPLEASIARMISEDLAVLLPRANIQLFPCNFAIPLDYQVIIEVIQLDSNLDGNMYFTAQWSIIDSKERKMAMTQRSHFSQPITPHNYFGLSRALSAVCASLSREIAVNLETVANPDNKKT